MDGRHDDSTVSDLKEKQRAIDGMISNLLNFNPVPLMNGELQKRKSVGNISADATSSTSSSPSSQAKKPRGPGRPPKVNVPPASLVVPRPAQGIPLDSIIECLKEIHDQSKKLLNFVEVLANKVESHITTENPTLTNSENSVPAEQPTVLEDVNNRLEKLEQNLNSNTLICRGPEVEKLVSDSSSGEATNLELLKGKLCDAICGEEVASVDVRDLRVSLYGRDRKCVRLSCANPASKIHLIRKARERRPEGVFVNKFLTSNKLKIYRGLRQLKVQHPTKIKAVFTRNGNVLYSLHDTNQVINVSSVDDLSKIVRPEEIATSSSSN